MDRILTPADWRAARDVHNANVYKAQQALDAQSAPSLRRMEDGIRRLRRNHKARVAAFKQAHDDAVAASTADYDAFMEEYRRPVVPAPDNDPGGTSDDKDSDGDEDDEY